MNQIMKLIMFIIADLKMPITGNKALCLGLISRLIVILAKKVLCRI